MLKLLTTCVHDFTSECAQKCISCQQLGWPSTQLTYALIGQKSAMLHCSTAGACSILSKMLHIVAQVLRLQACSELSLFQACMIWAEAPGRSMQEVEQLLPLIRYPFMTQQELQVGAALYCSAA